MKNSPPHQQKGAVAIEFALVFVVFFAVFYGIVAYSLPLLLMQSFNQATSEAVRRSVAMDPNTPNYSTAVVERAYQVLDQQLSWVPARFNLVQRVDTNAVYSAGTLRVSINYPSAKLAQVIPLLVLPGIGTVPNLPVNLQAQSSLTF
jgi:Flp pilus assembly protein TadG